MIPMLAIFAVVLLGCTAIATDLSVATHYKRNLQNITDAAALAAAKQLPATVTSTNQSNAAQQALEIIHNQFPWSTPIPGWASTIVNTDAGCGGASLTCSITICAGLSLPACTAPWQNVSPNGNPAFNLTINIPPKQAPFNSPSDTRYYQRAEVLMQSQSGGYFAGIFGVGSNIEGARSVAYHFAPNQPFPFVLFSNTLIGDGNSPEVIDGNVYAARFVTPQADGKSAVCAVNDPNGNPGYIVLGAKQIGDPGYANDGQANDPSNVHANAATIQDGPSITSAWCTANTGKVGMSGQASNCTSAFAGTTVSGNIAPDLQTPPDACEANPALQVPQVAALPNIPNYDQPLLDQPGCTLPAGTVLDPTKGAYQCGGKYSLIINSNIASMNPGIYEILPASANVGKEPACDLLIDGTFTNLTGVTFYLKNGASMCVNPISGGAAVTQTPYCASASCPSAASPGDGVYAVLSDNALQPTITMSTTGGGSTSGIWSVQGTIWLPTGVVNISNKDALEDTGQVLVNTWNDTSGNHPNPSVTYNGSQAPPQPELLQLVG
jgi:hypothetical protein